MPSNKRFPALLEQYLENNLTQEEEQLFVTMLKSGAYDAWLSLDIQQKLESDYEIQNTLNPQQSDKILQTILREEAKVVPFKQTNTNWWRYAAIVLVVVGAGMYGLINNKSTSNTPKTAVVIKDDILPGGNRATLTLADGTIINLDSVQNGTLAQQGNSAVLKLENGQIEYATNGQNEKDIVLNTMTTPRGGQFKLILPDGSKVWLNAASSISYPTSFNARFRNVKITGEAYFEVATVKAKKGEKSNIPFYVDVSGKATIAVLGTQFNVNSYEDESNIKTTLLQGAVKVTQPALKDQGSLDLRNEMVFNTAGSVLLNPGQQATLALTSGINAPQKITVTNELDIEKIIAWKNGLFNFEQVSLETVMREISRWYDVEIVYEGVKPSRYFEGKMDRGLTLSQVMTILSETDIKFRLEGRKLFVSR